MVSGDAFTYLLCVCVCFLWDVDSFVALLHARFLNLLSQHARYRRSATLREFLINKDVSNHVHLCKLSICFFTQMNKKIFFW